MKNKISSMIICVMMVGQLHAEPQEDSGESSLIESCGQGEMAACKKLASLKSSYEYSRSNPRPEPYSSWESKVYQMDHSSDPLDQYNLLKLGAKELIRRKTCQARIKEDVYGAKQSKNDLCDTNRILGAQSLKLIEDYPDENFFGLDPSSNELSTIFEHRYVLGRTAPFVATVYAKLGNSKILMQSPSEIYLSMDFYILDTSKIGDIQNYDIGDVVLGYAKIETTERTAILLSGPSASGPNSAKKATVEDYQTCVASGREIRETGYGSECKLNLNIRDYGPRIKLIPSATILIMSVDKTKVAKKPKEVKKLKPSRPIKK